MPSLFLALSLLLPAALVRAAGTGVTPTGPAPNDVFNEGSTCTIEWDPDTTGKWTQMNVKLMTGSNDDMVVLKTIISNGDGTASPGSYSYPCPSVSPNSAIYFYEFTNGDDASTDAWTGRFAIADQSGNTTPPPNETDGIAWGEGKLVGSSSGSTNGTTSTTSVSSSGSASTTTSGSSSSSTGSSGGSSTTTSRQVTTTSVTGTSTGAQPTSDDTSGARAFQTAGAAALAGLVAVGSMLF